MPDNLIDYKDFRERCFSIFPTMETERFLLLKCDKAYEKDYESLLSDDEVMKYSGTEIFDLKKQIKLYLEHLINDYSNKKGIHWVIIDKVHYKFIGEIGIYNLDLYSNRCEIGYTILKKYWRNKVATECIKRVLKFAFKELYMHKVVAIIDINNDPSIKLVESLGFKEEGMLKEHYYNYKEKSYINVELWAMIRKEEIYSKVM
ncbi:GNAT family N-acetyltransferase [Clostridium senegalense]|uniref:GNAT family N-acetyltransferase n=1 Tax=Clostridium senegalense TaxID=1465809 RepID=A0A6M0H3R4_9CLOT|nr:GNAT family N-acetyltransferase [Clostridium senegalense]NEU04713.1 GNAT family N-acetyltransferase [Clostridium senegalense]